MRPGCQPRPFRSRPSLLSDFRFLVWHFHLREPELSAFMKAEVQATSVLVDDSQVKGPTRVKHVFAHQKGPMMGPVVRTIGIARARVNIGLGQSRLQHAPVHPASGPIGRVTLHTDPKLASWAQNRCKCLARAQPACRRHLGRLHAVWKPALMEVSGWLSQATGCFNPLRHQ